MLKSITRAMVVFFDQTPIGVILNRFSNDLGASDKQNVNIFYDSIEGLNYLVFFVITLMWVSPVVITPSVIVMLILWRVKIFFAKPTVDSRRLDLISRSPIYSEIS
jgi:ATP-binding cassette subfamily C (CFTR/MRP) protein 4